MIDFEKTHETTPGVTSGRDDGYLTGLESATDLLSSLILPAAETSEWKDKRGEDQQNSGESWKKTTWVLARSCSWSVLPSFPVLWTEQKPRFVSTSKNRLEINLFLWVHENTSRNNVILNINDDESQLTAVPGSIWAPPRKMWSSMNDDESQLTGLESFDLLPYLFLPVSQWICVILTKIHLVSGFPQFLQKLKKVLLFFKLTFS